MTNEEQETEPGLRRSSDPPVSGIRRLCSVIWILSFRRQVPESLFKPATFAPVVTPSLSESGSDDELAHVDIPTEQFVPKNLSVVHRVAGQFLVEARPINIHHAPQGGEQLRFGR